ncbi:MAG: helix-turn-helix transcriptional regulator [Clostridia bacterium]|nr:helix-turn-helix transcriptional regulator [Clostridia bacterium]
MNYKDLLYRIGAVREKANLSARELSLRLGMSYQYMAKVESGKININLKKLLQILEICNCSIEEFLCIDYGTNKELISLIEDLPSDTKQKLIDFLKTIKK